MATTMTYDGETVTLKDGDSTTFHFGEKAFKTNITMHGKCSVSYDGQTVSVADGESITFKCKDLKARDNIIVNVDGNGETPTEYILSGTWLFNDKLVDLEHLPDTLLDFTSSDKKFKTIYYDSAEEVLLYASFTVDGIPLPVEIYRPDTHFWTYSGLYKKITIVDPQPVSAEFYEWFVTNAKPLVADLTGTTWMLNASVNETPKSYNITGTAKTAGYSFTFNNMDLFHPTEEGFVFRILIRPDVSGTSLSYNKYLNVEREEWYLHYNSGEFMGKVDHPIVSITGGNDTTEPGLIEWFYDNAQLVVTDLTGTTWTVNEDVDVELEPVEYTVVGTVTAGEYSFTFDAISFETSSDSRGRLVITSTDLNSFVRYSCNPMTEKWGWNMYYEGYFVNYDGLPVLTFTGGVDAGNSELIEWFYVNATRDS